LHQTGIKICISKIQGMASCLPMPATPNISTIQQSCSATRYSPKPRVGSEALILPASIRTSAKLMRGPRDCRCHTMDGRKSSAQRSRWEERCCDMLCNTKPLQTTMCALFSLSDPLHPILFDCGDESTRLTRLLGIALSHLMKPKDVRGYRGGNRGASRHCFP
jgi:hypothetical protein